MPEETDAKTVPLSKTENNKMDLMMITNPEETIIETTTITIIEITMETDNSNKETGNVKNVKLTIMLSEKLVSNVGLTDLDKEISTMILMMNE